MTIQEHREIVSTDGVQAETRVTTSHFVFSPGQVIAAVLGAVTAIIGIIAIARAGIDGSLNVPVVSAAGLHESAMVGLIELGLGLLLLLGAFAKGSRDLIGVIGATMLVGGVIVGASGATVLRDLGTTQHTGWVIMVGGVIALVAAAMGRMVKTSRRVTNTAE